jgi:hypothetical protein
MSIRAGEFTLGLGDVVFYTMLPSLPLAQLVARSSMTVAAAWAFATLAVMDVGVVATLFLLSRRRLLPGLPIPMVLGVLVLVLHFFF